MAIRPLKAWHKVSMGSLRCVFKGSDLKDMEDERGDSDTVPEPKQ